MHSLGEQCLKMGCTHPRASISHYCSPAHEPDDYAGIGFRITVPTSLIPSYRANGNNEVDKAWKKRLISTIAAWQTDVVLPTTKRQRHERPEYKAERQRVRMCSRRRRAKSAAKLDELYQDLPEGCAY